MVKIQYIELTLSCGNDPVVKKLFIVTVTLIFDPKINRVLPFNSGIMWSSLVKIQYTELKLSCGNDPVVKNSIYSNCDLDLWPNGPKINRVLLLPQGNHVAKSGKDLIYRTKVIMRKPVWTHAARHTQSHNTAPSWDGRIKKVTGSIFMHYFNLTIVNTFFCRKTAKNNQREIKINLYFTCTFCNWIFNTIQ